MSWLSFLVSDQINMMHLITSVALWIVCDGSASSSQMCLCFQVIVERYIREKTLPLLDKTKFLVPFELTLGQFLCLLR